MIFDFILVHLQKNASFLMVHFEEKFYHAAIFPTSGGGKGGGRQGEMRFGSPTILTPKLRLAHLIQLPAWHTTNPTHAQT